jgi:aspartyl protease family protein
MAALRPSCVLPCEETARPYTGLAMRSILILAVAFLIMGGYAARFADQAIAVKPQAPPAATQASYEPQDPVTSGRSLMIEANRQGHFQVDARIEGRHFDFMVDTGASVVALRESDAAQVGIHPMPVDYTARVSTANGTIKAAPAKLDRIEVGGITVYDVQALVLPDDALGVNLLGVSFLSRLKRYEYANGRLVLEQ